jgi:hypothetical protein
MDRKEIERQAQLLRNKRHRLESRKAAMRGERPKITRGAIVQTDREAKGQPLNSSPPSPTSVERLKIAQRKKRRMEAMQAPKVKKTSGCGGCRRGR